MQEIYEKLKEIDSGEIGIIIFSQLKMETIYSYNKEVLFPLASTSKVAIGYVVASLIEEGLFKWDDVIEDIRFDPKEASKELYPHFQGKKTLALRDAVEVTIACHDNLLANRIVHFCGGWEQINLRIKSTFDLINISQNPLDEDNRGELRQVLELMRTLFRGYQNNPERWLPIMNGLVRQRANLDGIPAHFLNHMTGGLENALIDIGIIGEFSQSPLLYVLAAKDLPSRYEDTVADEKIQDILKSLYEEYLKQNIEKYRNG